MTPKRTEKLHVRVSPDRLEGRQIGLTDLLATAARLDGPIEERGVLIDVGPKDSIDSRYAHRPAVIALQGALYHFYCAVSEEHGRGIGDWHGRRLFEQEALGMEFWTCPALAILRWRG